MSSASNLAERISLQVSNDIRTGLYKPGQQLPAERELVRTYKASRVTINRALAMLDAKGVLQRRHGVGTFVCEQLPSAERKNGGMNGNAFVKFISPSGFVKGDIYVVGGQEEMHRELDKLGKHLVLGFYRTEEEYLRELQKVSSSSMYGVLLWHQPSEEGDLLLRNFQDRDIRYVLMDSYCRALDCDYVVSDNLLGAQQMVDYLVSQGHRNIVYVSEELGGFTSLEDRRTGFISGMMNHRCQVTNDSVLFAQIGDEPAIERVVDSILNRPERPTAVFAGKDMLAFDLYHAFKRRGIRVPRELSLAGFDDIDRSKHFDVPLTTIAQDFREMGRVAVALLNKQMDMAGSREFFHQIKIKPTLVFRDSVQTR